MEEADCGRDSSAVQGTGQPPEPSPNASFKKDTENRGRGGCATDAPLKKDTIDLLRPNPCDTALKAAHRNGQIKTFTFAVTFWPPGAKRGKTLMRSTSVHTEFLHLFRRCEADVRAFIGAMIRDRHAREDLFQEVCRTLWEKFDTYDLDRPFGAWARGIAALKLLEARRKNARFPLLFPPETVAVILDAFDRSEESTSLHSEALRLCLEELPERSRAVLKSRYELGHACDRIAEDTGASVKAVHQTLSRLRRALGQCIERRISRDELSAPDPANPSLLPLRHE